MEVDGVGTAAGGDDSASRCPTAPSNSAVSTSSPEVRTWPPTAILPTSPPGFTLSAIAFSTTCTPLTRLWRAGRDVEQLGGDSDLWIGLAIPEGEPALQGFHAEPVWPVDATADIGAVDT